MREKEIVKTQNLLIHPFYCLSQDEFSDNKFLMTSCSIILTKQGLKHQYVATLFVMQEYFPSTPMFVEKLN